MRFKLLSTLLVSGALLVAAQTYAQLSAFPTCAQACLLSGIEASGCDMTDYECTCTSTKFFGAFVPCASSACSAKDVEQTRTAAINLCKSVGVDVSAEIPDVSTAPAAAAKGSQAFGGQAKASATDAPAPAPAAK